MAKVEAEALLTHANMLSNYGFVETAKLYAKKGLKTLKSRDVAPATWDSLMRHLVDLT